MSFRIEINKQNTVSTWVYSDGFYFTGHVFDKQGNYLPNEKGLNYLKSQYMKPADYGKVNGVFSVIHIEEETGYIYSDKSRFYPVFYTMEEGEVLISDNFYFLVENSSNTEIDELAKLEFLAGTHTFNNRTLVKQVKQVNAGELLTISKSGISDKILIRFCFTTNSTYKTRKQALQSAAEVMSETGRRLASSLQGKPVLLPLSGGYDSRLIACWLKENNITNVHCFTFGRKGYYEVDISRKVAEKLGYGWSFIEFNDKLINGFLQEEKFHHYYRFLAQGTSMFFMQDYFPLRELTKKGIVMSDSIAIPGHSGDGIGGSLLNKSILIERKGMSIEESLVSNFCTQQHLSVAEKKVLQQQIASGICADEYSFSSLQEDWLFREKLAKYIFNSSRAFSFFGMETRFPFWDNDLVKFFMSLPLEYRLNKNLYDETVEENYFKKYEVYFGSAPTPTFKQLKKQRIKNCIRPYLPLFMKDYYRKKNDWTFYNEMTREFNEELEKNKWEMKDNGSAFTYRILNWYLFKLNEIVDK